MLLSSLLALIYIWRVVETLYFGEPSEQAKNAKEAPWALLIPTYLAIGGTLVFGVWTTYSTGLALQAARGLLEVAP